MNNIQTFFPCIANLKCTPRGTCIQVWEPLVYCIECWATIIVHIGKLTVWNTSFLVGSPGLISQYGTAGRVSLVC